MADLIKQIERFTVDSKLDLTAQEVNADYPQHKIFEGTVNTGSPIPESFSIKINDVSLKTFTVYPLDTNLSVSISEGSYSVKSGVVFQDQSFKLKKSWFRKMYLYKHLKNDDGTYHIPKDEVGDAIPFEVNRTKYAEEVLRDALSASSVSLTVVWDAPRYSVVNKFNRSVMYDTDISGLISELISPFQFSERYPTLVYIDGNVLHIKKVRRTSVATTLDLSSAPILGCKVTKSLSLKPDVDKVIIEYFEEKTPNVNPVVEIDIEVTKDRNQIPMATVTNTRTTICDVLTEEKQETSRALVGAVTGLVIDATLYPVSKKITTYTYDVAPSTLDGEGMFQPYRILLSTLTVEEHYLFPDLSKELFQKVNTSMLYGYANNKLVQEIETSDHYNSLDWNTPFKTTKTVTSHIKTDKDKIEIRVSNYLNDELSTTVSTFREGQLQETPRTNENEGDNHNYEIKYVKVTGGGSLDIGTLPEGGSEAFVPTGGGTANGKVVNLGNKLLSKAQLMEGAQEILRDGSYIKYSLELQLAPLIWLTKGGLFNLTLPNINYTYAFAGDKVTGVLNLTEMFSGLDFLLEDQNYSMENNSLIGSITFSAYKYL